MSSILLAELPKKDIWYKEPWLLLVVGGPLLVVCASLLTGFIAFRGADQVVAKDYYRQGLMINTNLQRDAKARELQLNATLQIDLENQKVRMTLYSQQSLPAEIQLSLASSGVLSGSVSEIVRRLPLKQIQAGQYEGRLTEAKDNNPVSPPMLKLLHVKLETNDWRLTGDWHDALQTKLQLLPLK